MSIPKIIHYCWFGKNEYPPIMKKCIKSWQKHCPDYKFVLWNEDNFDVDSSEWTRQAYGAKKYAFVADYVRIKVLKEYGGIYLDIDQELIKPIDMFLSHSAFFGFMRDNSVTMGIIGAEPNHPTICNLFRYYNNRKFIINGEQDLLPITDWVTEQLLNDGLELNGLFQELHNGAVIYPRTFFCPTSCSRPKNFKSKKTVSIHHWAMTWRTEADRNRIINLKKNRKKEYYIQKIYIIRNKIISYPIRIYRKIKRIFNWK